MALAVKINSHDDGLPVPSEEVRVPVFEYEDRNPTPVKGEACSGPAANSGDSDEDENWNQRCDTDDRDDSESFDDNHNMVLGMRGEDAAACFLERRGYEIIERNWRCRAGEADIIADDDGVLVFVEVKTRSNIDHGFPEEAVDWKRRSKYEKIAAYYLRDHDDYSSTQFRFDVIGILVIGPDRAAIRHHINAFGTC